MIIRINRCQRDRVDDHLEELGGLLMTVGLDIQPSEVWRGTSSHRLSSQ